MIVPMKKITLLMSRNAHDAALKKLRSLGVLHIKHVNPPQSGDVDTLAGALRDAEKAQLILENLNNTGKSGAARGDQVVREILDLNARRALVESGLEENQNLRSWFNTWGDVSLASIQALENAGIEVTFYRMDRATLKKLPDRIALVILGEEKGTVYTVQFTDNPEEKLDLRDEKMPRVELDELDEEIRLLKKKLAEINKQIESYADRRKTVQDHVQNLRKELALYRVQAGMGSAEGVVFLQGFCPQEALDAFKDLADRENWGYRIEDPDDPSEVPTLLKNSKPIRIIEPLFKFMGTLPGYHEVDVSFVFLVFFSVFYAMIIGDAGYGLVFLGGTLLARMKNRKAPFEPFALFFVLSITTIIWGALTGTWFGSRAIAQWPPLKGLIIEPMFSFNNSAEATRFMMKLSFIVGLIHLVIGRIMAFMRKLPDIRAVAELGWAVIVTGIFFVVDFLVLSNPMPGFVMPVMAGGLAVVGIFANFQRNPLKLLGSFFGTILNSALDVISGFSDVVSYIRLFAVGVASVTVAASFNAMAHGLLAPLILIFGHGLNIILSLMSVMVHGVRLNMLEFSGHLGQEWSGKAYEPFSESTE